jgi:hypothetical protein
MPQFDAQHMFYWLGCLGALLWLANASLGLLDRLKPKPPLAEVFISSDRFETEISGLKQRLDAAERALIDFRSTITDSIAQGETRASKIHDRINTLGEHLAKTISDTSARMSRDIGELRGEIKRM